MSGELINWLKGQIDQVEKTAQAACGGFTYADDRWRYDGSSSFGPKVRVGSHDDAVWEREVNEAVWMCNDERDGCPELARQWAGEGQHMASWDPDRVIRLVWALRRLIALHVVREGTGGDWDTDPAALCNECSDLHPCCTLRVLTGIFSDGPGYQEAWRP